MPDTFNRSDVFISYSRRDKSFVQKLDAGFKALKKEVWVDWEDIPATADWWAEIQAGINAADAFVFVISPDSVTSDICRKEIEHALEINKRLIPILYREVEDENQQKQMHPAISSHNWLFFREHDDFDAAFNNLNASLETDLNHNRLHTRILVRAREWTEKGQNKSLLMQGDDLEEAETWMTTAVNKDPRPTELHAQYIKSSRQRATNSQRRFIALSLVVMAISTLLALFAVIQWQEAQEAREQAAQARERAEQTSREAQSLALASSAQQALLNNDPDLAIVLALDANTFRNPLPIAPRALIDAAYHPGTRRLLDGHTDAVRAIAYSPGGEFVLSGADDSTACLWNPDTGDQIRCLTGHTGDVVAVAFMRNGTAVTASSDATVRLWNPQTGEETQQFNYSSPILSIDINDEDSLLMAGAQDGHVVVWDISSGEQVYDYAMHEDVVAGVAFSPDGVHALSGAEDSVVQYWVLETGEVVYNFIGHDRGILSVDFSPNGDLAVSTSRDHSISLWDTSTGQEDLLLLGHNGGVTDAIFVPETTLLLTSSWDNSVRLWDISSGRTVRTFYGHNGGINGIGISPNGEYVASGSFDSDVRVWAIHNVLEITRFYTDADPVGSLDYNPDGRRIVAVLANGDVIEWHLDTRERFELDTPYSEYLTSVAYSGDGMSLVAGGDEGTIAIWNVRPNDPDYGEVVWESDELTQRTVSSVDFSADSSMVLASAGANVYVFDAGTGEAINTLTYDADIAVAAFAPNNRYVAAGYYRAANNLVMRDIFSGDEIQTFDGHNDGVLSLAFNTEGDMLLSGSYDNSVRLWETGTGEMIRVFTGHSDRVTTVDFDAQSSLIVSGSNDMTVRLWSVQNGAEIARFAEHTDHIRTVRFDARGPSFVSASDDASIIAWRIPQMGPELNRWVMENRYVRELTCSEELVYHVESECEVE